MMWPTLVISTHLTTLPLLGGAADISDTAVVCCCSVVALLLLLLLSASAISLSLAAGTSLRHRTMPRCHNHNQVQESGLFFDNFYAMQCYLDNYYFWHYIGSVNSNL